MLVYDTMFFFFFFNAQVSHSGLLTFLLFMGQRIQLSKSQKKKGMQVCKFS